MAQEHDTWLLDQRARRLDEVIVERGRLWQDSAGRALMQRHLRPHAASVDELVDAFKRRDQALAALHIDLVKVRQEVELAQREGACCDVDMERVHLAAVEVDRAVDEILEADALAAELEAEAIRLANLANALAGEGVQGPSSPKFARLSRAEWDERRRDGRKLEKERRRVELDRLQTKYPEVDVQHVLEGEVNPCGQFTGFHSRRSLSGKVMLTKSIGKHQVYTANVVGMHPNGHCLPKLVITHTMFPDNWTDDKICEEITHAYREWSAAELEAIPAGAKTWAWRGQGRSGVSLEGFRRKDGRIIGHPIIERS